MIGAGLSQGFGCAVAADGGGAAGGAGAGAVSAGLGGGAAGALSPPQAQNGNRTKHTLTARFMVWERARRKAAVKVPREGWRSVGAARDSRNHVQTRSDLATRCELRDLTRTRHWLLRRVLTWRCCIRARGVEPFLGSVHVGAIATYVTVDYLNRHLFPVLRCSRGICGSTVIRYVGQIAWKPSQAWQPIPLLQVKQSSGLKMNMSNGSKQKSSRSLHGPFTSRVSVLPLPAAPGSPPNGSRGSLASPAAPASALPLEPLVPAPPLPALGLPAEPDAPAPPTAAAPDRAVTLPAAPAAPPPAAALEPAATPLPAAALELATAALEPAALLPAAALDVVPAVPPSEPAMPAPAREPAIAVELPVEVPLPAAPGAGEIVSSPLPQPMKSGSATTAAIQTRTNDVCRSTMVSPRGASRAARNASARPLWHRGGPEVHPLALGVILSSLGEARRARRARSRGGFHICAQRAVSVGRR